MAKTTIDGLRVRESDDKQRPANVVKPSNNRVVDMTTRTNGKSQNQSCKRQEMIDSIEAIRRQQTEASGFLDPVQTFDFDNEGDELVDDEFDESMESDWSELLSDFASAPVNTKRRTSSKKPAVGNDFLNSWNEGDDKTDFLSVSMAGGNDTGDEEDKMEEAPRRQKKQRAQKKKHHVGRNLAISFVCLLVIGGGIIYKWGDELIAKLTGGNSGLWDAIVSMVSDEVPFEMDKNGRTNILIFGTEGYNMNGDTAYGAHDGAQLTDSIMVVSFDQESKDIALLSLPRDLKVSRACSAGKINEVFWCHNQDGTNEEAGATALMGQVGDVLGLSFQYYAHINWASLIDIIDTLGGITVTLDEDIADYGYTGAVAQAGVPMEVNGEQALGLARARHGTMGGDFTRGNTQQKIVEAIINKVVQDGLGVNEALGLLGILGDNLRSNFSTDNVKAGMRLVAGLDISKIRQIPLVDYENNTFYMTTANINDISYVVPSAGANNYSEIKKYVAEMLAGNEVTREKARIAIYNASGQYGVAAAERERLQKEDYNVVGVGDAVVGDCLEPYCVYNVSNHDFTATAEMLAQRYGTVVRSVEELPSSIEPGEVDFIIVIGFSEDEV